MQGHCKLRIFPPRNVCKRNKSLVFLRNKSLLFLLFLLEKIFQKMYEDTDVWYFFFHDENGFSFSKMYEDTDVGEFVLRQSTEGRL